MNIGNPDSDKCECGGHFDLISWCPAENRECQQECGKNLEDIDCLEMEERLKCSRCDSIFTCE